MQTSQENFRRATPVTPGGAFQQNSGWTNYIPPPPPIQQQQGQVGSAMYPPPPPRLPMGGPQHFVPPPPGQGGYTAWNRQGPYAMPSNANQTREPRAYDPSLYHGYEGFNQNLPADNQPLTSATYIPGGESFGPGVGIPPLHTHSVSLNSPPTRSTVSPPQHEYYRGQSYDGNTNIGRYNSDGTFNDAPGAWYPGGTWQPLVPSQSAPPQQISQSLPPPTPTTARQKTLILPAKETEQHKSPSQEHNNAAFGFGNALNSDTIMGDAPASPDDAWPPERVQGFLAANNFSREWQDAFLHLNVRGAQFLDIGRGAAGEKRGNIGFMRLTVLPQVARECTANNVVWDQTKEHDQGKRLRRLVRAVVKYGGAVSTPQSSTNSLPLKTGRSPSNNFNSGSAGTEGGVESSPNLSRPEGNIWSSAGADAEDLPTRGMSTRVISGQRAATFDSAGTNTALNDAGRSHYSQHALGNFASDIVRRHSPSTSSDLGSPAIHAARPSNSGSGLGHGRVGHLRGNNSDTNITLSTASSSSTAFRDKAIHTPQDSSRSSSEAGKGSETPASAKERKGLFHKLGRRNKKETHDSVMPSPPDEEPASPHNSKQTPYSIQRSASSETSLAERSNSRKSKGQLSVDSVDEMSGHASHGSERQFIFVTPDCWNYRLIDVTDIESADQLRTAICFNLQIDESPDVAIYLTSPGQLEHEELLDDSSLVTIRKRTADSAGSLKLMVRAPYIMNGQPQSAGLGVMGLPTSPFSNALLQRGFPNEGPTLQSSSVDSPGTLGSGESTLVPDKFKNIRMLQKDSPTSAIPDRMRFDQKAAEHRKDTESKRDAFGRRESLFVDHNGKLIHDFDRGRSTSNERDRQNTRPASSGSADFERKTDSFQPMRKAPPVPEPTSTLVKANSLSKRNSTLGRTTWPSRKDDIWKRNSNDPIPEEHPGGKGIGAAIASISQAVGAVGHPNSAPAISSSLQNSLSAANPDSLQSSKGGQTFKMPGYNEGDGTSSADTLKAGAKPNLSLKMPPNTSSRNAQRDGKSYSPNLSPGSRNPPNTTLVRVQSKRGPSFDVPESLVQFESSFDTYDDSDEDSDDGLFAIPLANQKQKTSAPRVPPKAAAILGVQTDTPILSPNKATIHAKSSRSNVKFDPTATSSRNKYSIDEGNERSNQYYGSVSSSTAFAPSPLDDATRFGRRESFASDVWANRPPVEGIAEHLDEFFPNVDLDQPMGEDVDGGEASPVDRANLPSKPSLSDLSMNRAAATMSNHDHDTTGGESTFKRGDLTSVAQRSIRKQGGLGRTKSIRDVVKNNYQSGPNPQNASISSQGSSRVPSGQGLPIMLQNHPSNRLSTLRNDGGIVRRKSTKMFGAKIEQVKTRPGSRLIQNLDPIPQDSIPKGNLHHHRQERQPTFKWMKGQLIGKGTFGRVYLGMNTTTGELLAVKQVEVNQNIANADPAKIREMVKALDMEIDTMQHLDHMNIVQYLGCERKEYSISIFLEYISGGSIGSCLRKHGKFEESVVSSLTRQTLSGLRYLHSECILHRDLKADNILLDLDGTCKISDFGISKKSEDPYNNDITNSMQGSVFWMAPEVIRAQSSMGSSSSDHAANMSSGYSAKVDIWSLGCVVLEMFAGRRPWSKEEAIGAIYKLGSLNQAPPIPDDVSSVIRPAALSFMLDCFTINPGDRPTADTLLHAPFCEPDPHYNFLDTELYAKIRGAF